METQEVIPHDLPTIGKGTLIVLGLVVAILIAGAFAWRFAVDRSHRADLVQLAQQIADAPPVVDAALPERSAADFDLTLPANAMPKQQTAIYARVDGYVKRWLVDINDHVQKGQLLAEIEAPDTDAQLNQTRAALQQAKANVVKAQADLELANATYQRYHGLLPTGDVTQQDLDTRYSNANDAVANKAAADAAVQSAQATVERLEAQQGFEKIYAPFNGTITFRNYDVGARISSTDTTPGHEMFDIADTDQLRIYVSVPQNYATLIHADQKVKFVVRNYPDRPFEGKVARSAGILDPATRTLLTELDFDNSDGLLWSGMYGQVQIHILQLHPVLTIPTASMMFEADGTQVAIVEPDNKIHFQKVAVGTDLGQRLEVLSGLSGNEQVVNNPGEKLAEGITVQIASQRPRSGGALAGNGQTSVALSVAPAPVQGSASAGQGGTLR